VAVTPDGARALSGSWDGTLRLWDLETGAELVRVSIEARVRAVACSGNRVVAGDADGRIHMFELRDA
jgi:WD40 repeat protein